MSKIVGWVISFTLIDFSKVLGLCEGMHSVGVFRKGSQTVFTRVSEKTTENTERPSQLTRMGIEPDTSRLPVLKAEPFGHQWGNCYVNNFQSKENESRRCTAERSSLTKKFKIYF